MGGLFAGGVILQCESCATNPYTNRWQLFMVPQFYEEQLGAQAYRDVSAASQPIHDPVLSPTCSLPF